jgi:hypothetical protein
MITSSEQVVQRLLIGAADIHARAPTHWFQAFKHLDVVRGVAALGPARRFARAGAARGPACRGFGHA